MAYKECCNCRYFEAYYTKAYCSFLRTDCGNCCRKKDVVKKHFTCDDWARKVRYRETNTYEIECGINQAITDLNEIASFLQNNSDKR